VRSVVAAVSAAGNLKTALRLPHPWFGPLDAAGWHALAAGHMAIHRVQIERILQGLAKAPSNHLQITTDPISAAHQPHFPFVERQAADSPPDPFRLPLAAARGLKHRCNPL